jgi:hypothetical protein
VTIHPERLSHFRLLIQPPTVGVERRCQATSLPEVAVARGVSSIDVEHLASHPRLSVARRRGGWSTRALHFEPISAGGQASLLMLSAPGVETRLNDRPAPRLAVLDVGDQLQVGETLLHVTRYTEFAVGPPTPELLGRKCGVCRVPFDEDTRVYVHSCGSAMHMEDESKPAGERLECAALGACPDCEQPVVMQSGYEYLPEV